MLLPPKLSLLARPLLKVLSGRGVLGSSTESDVAVLATRGRTAKALATTCVHFSTCDVHAPCQRRRDSSARSTPADGAHVVTQRRCGCAESRDCRRDRCVPVHELRAAPGSWRCLCTRRGRARSLPGRVQALCSARSTAARSAREPRLRSQNILHKMHHPHAPVEDNRQANVSSAATSAASSRAATPSSRLMTLSSAPVPCIVLRAACPCRQQRRCCAEGRG
jgi:hypothetical protein